MLQHMEASKVLVAGNFRARKPAWAYSCCKGVNSSNVVLCLHFCGGGHHRGGRGEGQHGSRRPSVGNRSQGCSLSFESRQGLTVDTLQDRPRQRDNSDCHQQLSSALRVQVTADSSSNKEHSQPRPMRCSVVQAQELALRTHQNHQPC